MKESVGENLRKVRLEKGISLEEAHKKTKLHLNILNALEEDNLINFSPVYIKGFLKIYCEFLGLDARDYIADYKEPKPIASVKENKQASKASILKATTAKIVYSKTSRIKIKKILVFILAVFLLFGLFRLGKIVSLKHKARENKTQKINLFKEEAKTLSIITLGIRAREDCWIKIVADGRIVFQSVLKKGRSEVWNAKDKVELSLGNAGGVAVEVNGKIISSLGKKGEVVRNILITKEALSVKR